MRKIVYLFLTVIFLILAVSCSNQNKDGTDEPKMLEVDLSVNPNPGQVNQPITFEAKVTQGKEKVNDADEVMFEIWRSKDETHEKIEVKHAENGIYRLEKSFEQEGTYYIISHVTAKEMHNMPKKEFVVGSPSESEDANAKDSMEGMDMDEHKEHEDHN